MKLRDTRVPASILELGAPTHKDNFQTPVSIAMTLTSMYVLLEDTRSLVDADFLQAPFCSLDMVLLEYRELEHCGFLEYRKMGCRDFLVSISRIAPSGLPFKLFTSSTDLALDAERDYSQAAE